MFLKVEADSAGKKSVFKTVKINRILIDIT